MPSKLIFSTLAFAFFANGHVAVAQYVPVVPEKLMMADVELTIREGAKAPLTAYVSKLTANNKYFRQMVDRADAYLPVVERIFAEEGLPDDFKYLVIQESSLVSNQVSSSNAVGYWQFKKETAVEMGLRVDDEVDERMNIVSSSRSAARYLVRHNNYMQNWTYSLLAYYAGLGGAKNLINSEKIGAKSLEIDENTHWYILKFIAHKIAFEPHLYRNTSTPNLRIQEFPDCENKSLDQLAQETNYPIDQLQFYNRWILRGYIPGDRDYTLILPLKTEEGFILESPMYVKAAPPVESLSPWRERTLFGLIEKPVTPAEPVVLANGQTETPVFFDWNGIKAISAKSGDNSAKLALLAGISRDEFLEYNDLRVFDPIVPGEVYYADNKKNRSKVPFHTAQHGETLWEVAQKYGLKMKALMAKNRMPRPEKLKPGRVLWLRYTRPDDEPIKYEPVPEPIKVNMIARKPVTVQPLAQTVANQAQQLRRVELVSKAIIGADSAKPERAETAAEQMASENIEIEIIPETVQKPAEVKPEPVALASIKPIVLPEPSRMPMEMPASSNKSIRYPNPTEGMIEVQPGMTWYQLSKNYRTPLDSLLAWNQGQNRSLVAGQKIIVEKAVAWKPQVKSADFGQKLPFGVEAYEVKPGDTVYKIASRYGMKVEDLLKLNNREDATLKIGEQLQVKR